MDKTKHKDTFLAPEKMLRVITSSDYFVSLPFSTVFLYLVEILIYGTL